VVAGLRSTTTVPAQSLFLLNNDWVIRQAGITADRLLAAEKRDGERIEDGYLLCFGRPPTEHERRGAEDFLAAYGRSLSSASAGGASLDRAAWTALCQAWFASAEFININ
jgi:hypothetical protein